MQPVLGEEADRVDVHRAERVERRTGLRDLVFSRVLRQFLVVGIAEGDLVDERMRFEQGDKTLGEGAGADDADSQAHVGMIVLCEKEGGLAHKLQQRAPWRKQAGGSV